MADAVVETRALSRFFCHKCNVEFEDALQDLVCPYCSSGFVEQLEGDPHDGSVGSEDDINDADMSNFTEDDHLNLMSIPPMMNDLAFLMSGGRVRGAGRPETLLEQLVWTIGGGAPGGTITAGAPFVLVGAPGDYVFGGEGLDAVVTQLLGQLENSGPPPLPREQINAIPSEDVTAEQAAGSANCSICWENFTLGEKISRLECDHIFHSSCIQPWLQLHATCPICRRSLLTPEQEATAVNAANESPPTPPVQENATPTQRSVPRVLLRRLPRRFMTALDTQSWGTANSGSTASMGSGSSVTTGGVWAPRSANTTDSSTSATSLNSSDHDRTSNYNMDIEFD